MNFGFFLTMKNCVCDKKVIILSNSPLKCRSCAESNTGKKKGIFRAKSEGKVYKKSCVSSHLFSYHTPKLAKSNGSKKRKVYSISLNQLSLNGKLSAAAKEEILQCKIDLACETGLSLNAVTSQAFSNYERVLWKYSNHDFTDFQSIPSSRRKWFTFVVRGSLMYNLGTIKRKIGESASKMLQDFKQFAPMLAKHGALSLLVDHNTIGTASQETAVNALGIMIGTCYL